MGPNSADESEAGRQQRLLEDALREEREVKDALRRLTVVRARDEHPTPEALALIGQQIDSYKIVEVLGEGGMGVVYRAEQREPMYLQVALKVIKLGMDTGQVVARFEAERQALALMDHPNVARVFGGGSTEDGKPYFVMEYVKGMSIAEHCDDRGLSIEERLRLFMQVCDGVQHAHQKGIIHRDVKPSNVIVMVTQDGKAIPKVIDFGVAKATGQRLTEKTLFTEQGQLVGTLEYMSPEQAEMTGLNIDTRTDIYSLGVLLYELLTGALPFDLVELRRKGFAEIVRTIREDDPPKPSARLSSLGDAVVTAIAKHRKSSSGGVLREIRKDLDWIVMKALEKERQRRYETANALAMDLQRHLNYEPVLAGPPSAAYKLNKFVRRNRTGVVATAFILVALLAATGVSINFAVSESEQRRIADLEKAIADAVNEFLTEDLLAAVAPSTEKGKGKDVLMRDVLDEAGKRIEETSGAGGRFEGKPLVEAAIRATLGDTYRQLGEYPSAELHLKRARTLQRRELSEEHPTTLATMHNLALVYWNQGRYDEAELLYMQTLEIGKRVLREEHPITLGTMHGLAMVYWNQGRYDEAEALHMQMLEIQKRVLGEGHSVTLNAMHILAALYTDQGHYDEAEPLHLQALETQKRELSEEHPLTLGTMHNLAVLYWNQGRFDEAEALYVQTLEIKKRVLGVEHGATLGTMNSLANLYRDQGRYDEAEPLFVQTLEIQKRLMHEEHSGGTMHDLAALYMDQGRYDEAEPLFVQTLEIQTRVLGEGHPETLRTMNNLSALLNEQGRYNESEALGRESVDTGEAIVGEDRWEVAEARSLLGEALAGEGHFDEAEPLLLEGHAGLEATLHGWRRRQRLPAAIMRLVRLYEALHDDEPESGYAAKATAWRAKLSEWEDSPEDESGDDP